MKRFITSSVIIALLALAPSVGFSAEDFNSSRSNLSYRIPIKGGSKAVRQSYKFNWSIYPGAAKLTVRQKKLLLEAIFKQIRKDVLRVISR